MFRKRYHRKRFFPFWVIIIFIFVFMGKSSFWMWMFPFFLIWMLGPMVWALSSGGREWKEREWKHHRKPIPPRWQAPPSSRPGPTQETIHQSQAVPQPYHPRSIAGLTTNCAACGGPVNPTTIEWRSNKPFCGYCDTSLHRNSA